MNEAERIERWLRDLVSTLDQAAALAARGYAAYQDDPALPLAFEALANRAGDLAKRLAAGDATRFADPIWSLAARNRDFVVHHNDRVDERLLWNTITLSFVELRAAAVAAS